MPSIEERHRLAELLEGVLGIKAGEVEEAVPIHAVELPGTELKATWLDTTNDARIRHTYGRSWPDLMRGFLGDFGPAPLAVAEPSSTEELEKVYDWAQDNDVKVQIYGGGTSVVGGVECNPEYPTISLDTSKLSGVLEIDKTSRGALIAAGAFGPDIEDALRPHGLTLRHFPQSFEFSTLGGWIATRSGGHFATQRTHIEDFVQWMEVVAPCGTVRTGEYPASGAGPDMNRVFAGSEGTMGLITKAWMRLQERPRYKAQASVKFAAWNDAIAALRAIAQSGLNPANARLLDSREALMNQVSFDGSNILVLGFESADHPLNAPMERALEIARDHHGQCDGAVYIDTNGPGAKESEKWKSAFLNGPYMQSALLTMGVFADTFETAVTWSGFERLHNAVIANMKDVLKRTCGRGFLTCRITHIYPDGLAPYYTWVAPMPTRDRSAIQVWQTIKDEAMRTLRTNGGTITHHHAVGRIHRDAWHQEAGPHSIAALDAMKSSFDPKHILNPGVLL